MLQDAKEEMLCKLAEAEGRNVSCLNTGILQKGSLVQVTTDSGSIYLLEINNSPSLYVHFARYSHNKERRGARYFGIQKLGSRHLAIGEPFMHDAIVTKRVMKITLLSE